MITKMTRLDVLLFHGEQEKFLHDLRDSGVVHVCGNDRPLDNETAKVSTQLANVEKVLTEIRKISPSTVLSQENTSPEDLVKTFLDVTMQIEATAVEENICEKELARFQPWGDVSLETLRRLQKSGLYISLYELNTKNRNLLEGACYEIIQETKTTLWVAAVSQDTPSTFEGYEEVILPEHSAQELRKNLATLKETQMVLRAKQQNIAAAKDQISNYRNELTDQLNMMLARHSMSAEAENHLFTLQGWIPETQKSAVENVLEKFSCWYEFSEPSKDDTVPVKMRNHRGTKLFESITKIFALPDYFELDPTPFFAPFYALFFGLCLGDVGYGSLLAIIAIVGMMKGPEKLRSIMWLALVLGIATIFSGVLLNSFFGAPIFPNANTPGSAFALLRETKINGKSLYPAMPFSIFLGIIQIILGMILKAVNGYRESGKFTYTLFPLGMLLLTISLTFALIKINFLDMASMFEVFFKIPTETVIASMTTTMMYIPLGIGLVLLFLFNSPDRSFGFRIPYGLWELYQYVTGIMGDGLSYIRLFALGLAGGLLGASFNKIAFMVSSGDNPKWMIIFTIIILVLGHTINFALSILGAFVHPLRLTFVEFYKHLGFKGGATAYKPFTKTENK